MILGPFGPVVWHSYLISTLVASIGSQQVYILDPVYLHVPILL